jgi:hypothetical protein
MSTSMSSDPIITRESRRCQRKPFLNLGLALFAVAHRDDIHILLFGQDFVHKLNDHRSLTHGGGAINL